MSRGEGKWVKQTQHIGFVGRLPNEKMCNWKGFKMGFGLIRRFWCIQRPGAKKRRGGVEG